MISFQMKKWRPSGWEEQNHRGRNGQSQELNSGLLLTRTLSFQQRMFFLLGFYHELLSVENGKFYYSYF